MRLGEICDINPSRPTGFRRAPDALTTFVPMSAVDEHGGVILNAEIRPFSEVAKGYTFFSEEDILFAKITPCMQNGKQAIARGLIDGIGFGSTEFHVIRPRPGVAPEWIHHLIRQPHILSAAANHFTGAVGQQRVPESFLASLEISLPSIDEQDRIMHIVNGQMTVVEKARAAAEARLEAAKALPEAYLRAVFESEEANGWQRVWLGHHVTKVGSGLTPLGGQSTYQKSGTPLIRSQNVHMNHFVPQGLAYIPREIDEEMAGSRVHPGDVLLNITGASIGRVCVVPSELCPANVNQHVSIIRCKDSLNPNFLSFYLSTPEFQRFIMNTQAGATRQALTKTIIEQFEIPAPPLDEQLHLVTALRDEIVAAGKVIQALQGGLETINALPAALLRRAFTGGL